MAGVQEALFLVLLCHNKLSSHLMNSNFNRDVSLLMEMGWTIWFDECWPPSLGFAAGCPTLLQMRWLHSEGFCPSLGKVLAGAWCHSGMGLSVFLWHSSQWRGQSADTSAVCDSWVLFTLHEDTQSCSPCTLQLGKNEKLAACSVWGALGRPSLPMLVSWGRALLRVLPCGPHHSDGW